MADARFDAEVVVTEKGSLAAKNKIRDVGDAVESTGKKYKDASKHTSGYNYTQQQGVLSNASSGRSFSKLAQTMEGGGGGIVGAYATLAANIFAVTAAFGALRNASQVEQILKGLEAAGLRTGESLVGTARALTEVTGNAISMEQAMRSTAVITSAGFDDKAVKQLGQAARDTAFALGRNMTDSLDRLTRGVVKLEPELLDELGIMTKLTESNVRFAQTLGKTESQLSSTEKRMGFMSAVMAEVELKFGGLSAAAGDSTNFDKLAATFTNLTNSIFNLINILAKPLAGLLSTSMPLLLGIGVLFASTLKSQLAPGLLNSANAAATSAKKFKELAEQQKENIETQRDSVRALNTSRLAQVENLKTLNNAPKAYLAIQDKLVSGTAEAKEYNAAIATLGRSVRGSQTTMENNPKFAENTTLGKAKKADIDEKNAQIKALTEARDLRQKISAEDIESSKEVTRARTEAAIATQTAARKSTEATALMAVSNGDYRISTEAVKQATSEYRAGLNIAAASTTTYAQQVKTGLTPALITARTGFYSMALSARVAGTALLNAIPLIGLIITAVGLLVAGINALKPASWIALEKATSDFNETANKAVELGNELARMADSQATASQRAAAALILQSNAVSDVAQKYKTLRDAERLAGNDSFGADLGQGIAALFTSEDTSNEVAGFMETLGRRAIISYNLGLRKNSKLIDTARAIEDAGLKSDSTDNAVKAINNLSEVAGEDLNKKIIKTYGSFDNFNKAMSASKDAAANIADTLTQELSGALGKGAEQVNTLREAFKQLETDLATFYKSAAISTPYDQIVKSSQAANSAIMALQDTYGNSEKLGALLTGIDATTASTFTTDIQNKLEKYQALDAAIQTLIASQKKLTDVGGRVSNESATILNAAVVQRQKLGEQTAQGLVKESMANEELYLLAQKRTRENASLLTLMQAQNQENSTLYKNGAAGARLKIADEERIRGVQKAQLQIQIDVLKSSVQLNLVKLDGLRTSLQEQESALSLLQTQKDIGLQAQKNLLTTKGVTEVQARAIAEGADKGTTLNRTLDAETDASLTSYVKDLQKESTIISEIAEKKKAIRTTDNAVRDMQSSIKALATQIAALNTADLNTAEKRAILQRAELEFNKESLAKISEIQKTLLDINDIYAEIDALANGTSNSLKYQLDTITRKASVERKLAADAQNERLRELAVARRETESAKSRKGLSDEARKAVESGLESIAAREALNEKGYTVDMQRIDAAEKLAIAQKLSVDVAVAGLEWQQQALAYTEKQLAAQKSLSDEIEKQFESRIRLAAKKGGYEVSREGEQAIEISAASAALKFAIEESKVKKSLIQLEFALLDAQRIQLREELRLRAANTQDPQLKAQLERAIENLNVDMGPIVTAAMQAVDENIKNLKTILESAMTNDRGGNKDSAANRYFSALAGEAAKKDALEKAEAVKNAKAREVGKVEGYNKTVETVTNPLIDSNKALITSLDDLRKTIDFKIGTSDAVLPGSYVSGAKDLIKKKEGFSSKPYYDVNAYRAGYGSDTFMRDGKVQKVQQGSRVTREEAEADLTRRVAEFERGVVKAVGPEAWDKVSNNAKAAVLSVAYNYGSITELKSLKNAIQSGNVEAIASAIRSYADHNNGVNRGRRNDEANLASTPDIVATSKEAAQITVDAGKEFASVVTNSATAANDNKPEIVVSASPAVVAAQQKSKEVSDTLNAGYDILNKFDSAAQTTMENLAKLGPQGEIIMNLKTGFDDIGRTGLKCFEVLSSATATTGDKIVAIGGVVSAALSTISSVTGSIADAKIANIDREIAAEQKRDGKSAESVAKIAALEKRKEAVAKKQFNLNKKIMMAQAVIATATGVAQALSYGPPGIPLAIAIGAMGAAQLAIIAGTSYQSSSSSSNSGASVQGKLSIGKRGDTVDLAKQNTNLGGEVGYLRGAQGQGTNSSNYKVVGSAYGGDLPRGYGNAAYSVGEKGPEIIEPMQPMRVRPSNDNSQANQMAPVNFTIQAIDSKGVAELLMDQRGNIIGMLREAANANGQPFLESVDTNVYTSPKISRL